MLEEEEEEEDATELAEGLIRGVAAAALALPSTPLARDFSRRRCLHAGSALPLPALLLSVPFKADEEVDTVATALPAVALPLPVLLLLLLLALLPANWGRIMAAVVGMPPPLLLSFSHHPT